MSGKVAASASLADWQRSAEIAKLRAERDALQSSLTPGSAATATPAPAPTPTPGPAPTSAAVVAPTPVASAPANLAESFAVLARRLGGSIGLAYASVGRSSRVSTLGDWRSGPGWSTVKVPLALAGEAAAGGHPDQATLADLRLAITESDNAAADSVWAGLGAPAAAAKQLDAVLRAGGDAATTVQSEHVRPGFSAFGQTDWSLAGQAQFAAALPCLPNSSAVLALMGQVIPSQRWGVGATGAAAQYKGGWGPDPAGRYLVRQLAVVALPSRERVGLALAAVPSDGTFATGTADLTAMAQWAVSALPRVDSGSC